MQKKTRLHPDFKLNGQSFSEEALLAFARLEQASDKDYRVAVGDFLVDWLSETDSVKVFTSGSTGKPKQIILQKEHMRNSALATGRFFNLQSGESALLCLSAAFIAGKMMLVRAMVLGLELVIVPPSNNPLKDLKENFDFVAMVPLQVTSSLALLNRVKTLIIGGAPVAKELKEQLVVLNTNSFETYGMTETITHIAAKNLKDSNFFQVLPGVTIDKDQRGCLVVKAPKVSYEVIQTNDVVELKGSQMFKWLGRWDNVINSGGIKLIPEVIEEKLKPHIPNRFFLFGVKDERLGQKLCLLIEQESVVSKNLIEGIKQHSNLTKFETPKSIYTLAKFVETDTGKVKRQATIDKLFL